jgi:deazaflavin-dependent oxidoreductase (nitroreductase family)
MPLPESLGRFNRVVTNRIARPFAAHLPAFAVVEHVGRKSGTRYRTPVNCWSDGDTAIIALTYGPDTDWLKNLTAAGGGQLVFRGHRYEIGAPEIVDDEGARRMPSVVRLVLAALDVSEYAVAPLLSSGRPI